MIYNLRFPLSKLSWLGQKAYLHISLTPTVDGTRRQKTIKKIPYWLEEKISNSHVLNHIHEKRYPKIVSCGSDVTCS